MKSEKDAPKPKRTKRRPVDIGIAYGADGRAKLRFRVDKPALVQEGKKQLADLAGDLLSRLLGVKDDSK